MNMEYKDGLLCGLVPSWLVHSLTGSMFDHWCDHTTLNNRTESVLPVTIIVSYLFTKSTKSGLV